MRSRYGDLIDTVRFNVAWEHRNDPVSITADQVDAEITKMSPFQLLQHISDALEEMEDK